MAEPPNWPQILVQTLFGGVSHPFNRLDVERVATIIASFSSAEFMLKNFPRALNSGHNGALLKEASKLAEIEGLVLEFGVHTGSTITTIANLFPQTVYGFDSFEGIPEDWTSFQRKGRYSTGGKPPANLPENVKLEIGLFQDTLEAFLQQNHGPIRFMHVDSDLYSSARFILQTVKSRIAIGTVIVFNDFLNYPGWENGEAKAWQEFTEYYKISFEYEGWASRESGIAVRVTNIMK
jgi:hypothetical protein